LYSKVSGSNNMKQAFYYLTHPFLFLFLEKRLYNQKQLRCIFPFYHLISDEKPGYIKNLYKIVTVGAFEKTLDYLLQHFKPVALNDIDANNPNGQKKYMHLSFDDGLRECYEIIAPILWRKGIPATFFINPSFVDNKALFHRYKASYIINKIPRLTATQRAAVKTVLGKGELVANLKSLNYTTRYKIDQCAKLLDIDWDEFLDRYKPYMTLEQIKSMHSDGFTIGAHSMHHPEFYEISEYRQLSEFKRSMDAVYSTVLQNEKCFAFPFTDYGVKPATVDKMKKMFPTVKLFGTAGIKPADSVYQRIPMEYGSFSGKAILKSEHLYYWMKTIIGKNK